MIEFGARKIHVRVDEAAKFPLHHQLLLNDRGFPSQCSLASKKQRQ